jgi:hypothetical protein
MAQVFKLINRIDKVNRATLIESVGSGRTRHHADPLNLRPGNPRLEIRKHFFTNRLVTNWNKLSREVKTSQNVRSFKFKCGESIREQGGDP